MYLLGPTMVKRKMIKWTNSVYNMKMSKVFDCMSHTILKKHHQHFPATMIVRIWLDGVWVWGRKIHQILIEIQLVFVVTFYTITISKNYLQISSINCNHTERFIQQIDEVQETEKKLIFSFFIRMLTMTPVNIAVYACVSVNFIFAKTVNGMVKNLQKWC